jgi:predicted GNAT superfamily acetyltransferase
VPDAGVSEKVEGFRFRKLEKPEEFRQVAEVERSVYGTETSGLAPPVPMQRALQDNGGLVLGAFADIYLAGATASTLGWDGTTLYHYSLLTAVRPEYQNHHLGTQLKLAQRDEVLRLGLHEVRWVLDPLLSRAAWLHVRRLGARPDRYYPHYFGQLGDAVNQGLETDRVRVVWTLDAPEVERRVGGKYPTAEEDRRRWDRSTPIVETEPGDSGIRVPTAVGEPSGPSAHLEIPFDLGLVRQHEPAALRRWRHAVRDAFRIATDLGYVVDDFAVVASEHERRSYFFLAPAPAVRPDPAPEPPP